MFKKSLIMALGLVLVMSVSALCAGDYTYVYQATGDGDYNLEAVYDVSPYVAKQAFAAQTDKGTGEYLNYSVDRSGRSKMMNSEEAFIDFLAKNYTPASTFDSKFPGQACDDIAGLSYDFICSPFLCPNTGDPNDCEDNVILEYSVVCYLDQSCSEFPNERCVWNKAASIVSFTTNIWPCECSPVPTECSVQPRAFIQTFVADGPICICVSRARIPTMSHYGLLVLLLLLIGSAVWLIRRRTSGAAA